MERYRPPPTEIPGNGARGVLIETAKKDIKIICGECKEETGEDIYFVRVERKRRNSNQSKPVEDKANQELQVELPVWEGKEENEETNSEEAAVKTRPDPGHHLG